MLFLVDWGIPILKLKSADIFLVERSRGSYLPLYQTCVSLQKHARSSHLYLMHHKPVSDTVAMVIVWYGIACLSCRACISEKQIFISTFPPIRCLLSHLGSGKREVEKDPQYTVTSQQISNHLLVFELELIKRSPHLLSKIHGSPSTKTQQPWIPQTLPDTFLITERQTSKTRIDSNKMKSEEEERPNKLN